MLLQVKWDSKGSYQLLFEKYEVKSCDSFGGDANWTLVIAQLYKYTKKHLRLLWEWSRKKKTRIRGSSLQRSSRYWWDTAPSSYKRMYRCPQGILRPHLDLALQDYLWAVQAHLGEKLGGAMCFVKSHSQHFENSSSGTQTLCVSVWVYPKSTPHDSPPLLPFLSLSTCFVDQNSPWAIVARWVLLALERWAWKGAGRERGCSRWCKT